MIDFDSDYPTIAAKAYRDDFAAAAHQNGLDNIPDDILSWAIDRAIQTRTAAKEAGRVFADMYFKIQTRRPPRGGYGSPTAYLLACYEGSLKGERS